MKKYVIFAPHVDDEMIGCWRLLHRKQVQSVVYFYDLTRERLNEAHQCAYSYDFSVFKIEELEDKEVQEDCRGTILLLPNISDYHPHHKEVNKFGLNTEWMRHGIWADIKYYSVDMNVKMDVLSEDFQSEKRRALLELFPSQSRLLSSEAADKYWLFESLLDTDWLEVEVETWGRKKMLVRPSW